MPELLYCPQCSAELPADAPEGLCPKCVFQLAAGDTDSNASNTGEPATQTGPTLPGPRPSPERQPPRPTEHAVRFKCPHCGNCIQLVEERPQEVTCGNCGSSFAVEPGATADYRSDSLPKTIGRFEVLEQLGRGAFGTVYKARDPQLDRLVAVKAPRAGYFATKEEEARFLREARSAARLQHPGIVAVHEIGHERGVPFIVSDFVDGLTLRDLLSGTRPSFRETAELAAKIAEALDYAHRQKIVHRDIKPENILLEVSGAVVSGGVVSGATNRASRHSPLTTHYSPKITDFGLAHRDEGEISVTVDGQILGTPAYMSPEQASGDSHRIDHRSDLYSLGVVLYELLAGELPFRGTKRMLLHQVLHEEPRPPRRLNDGIPKDLDTICLKAMAKEPARRSATAQDLADDLRRWLLGAPILARPIGKPERLARWCRRNPLVSGLTAALASVLVVGLVCVTVLWLRADERRQAAEAAETQMREQKQRADANLARARKAVQDYLTKTAADPRLHAGDFVALRRELLATAVPFFEEFVMQKTDDPELEAERGRAYGQLAFVRREMGEVEQALDDAEQARAIFAGLSQAHPDEPSYWANFAISLNTQAGLFKELGKHADAEDCYRAALTIRETLATDFPTMPVYRDEWASTLNELASLLAGRGDHTESMELHKKAIDVARKLSADFPSEPAYRNLLASCYGNLGHRYMDSGDLDKAQAQFDLARPLFEKLVTDHPADAQYRKDLAIHLISTGNLFLGVNKWVEAEAVYRRAVALREKLADDFPNNPEFRQSFASSCNNLGIILDMQGNGEEAEAVYRTGLAIRKKLAEQFRALPGFRGDLAGAYTNLGVLLRGQGKLDEAKEAYEQSIAIYEQLATEFPKIPGYQLSLAGNYVNLGWALTEPEESLVWFDKAIALLEPLYARDSRQLQVRERLGPAWNSKSDMLEKLGRNAEAREFKQKANALGLETIIVGEGEPKRADSPNDAGDDLVAKWTAVIQSNPNSAAAYVSRGVGYSRLQQLDEAVADYTKAIELDPTMAVAYRNRGRDYSAMEMREEAIADFTASIRLEPTNATAWCDRGRSHLKLDQVDEAIADCAEAIRLAPKLALAYRNRGEAYAKKEQFDDAIRDFSEAIRLEPNDANSLLGRADAHHHNKKTEPAIADYTEVIRLVPETALAYSGRANVHAEQKQFGKAIADYNTAIRLEPKNIMLFLMRALTHADIGEPERAIADYDEAIRLEPASPAPYQLRAKLHRERGDKAKADADEQKARELEQKNEAEEAYQRGVSYGSQGEYEKSVAEFTEAIRLDGKFSEAYASRGYSYLWMGEHEKAIADCTEAIRLDPRNANAFSHRANVYLNQEKFDLAIADYSEAIRLHPESAYGFHVRGFAYLSKKDYAAAIADFSESIRLGSQQSATWYNRGLANAESEEYDKALADFSEAMRLDPDDRDAHSWRAWVYLQQKKYDLAIAEWTELIRRDPRDVDAFINRGWAYSSKKEYEKALAEYKAVFGIDPENVDVHKYLAWLRSTCPDAKLRDGNQALEHAKKACELTEWKDPSYFESLAAAHAELGEFTEAVKWQTKAVEAPDLSQADLEDARARLALYEMKKPYRDHR